jgi:DMSO reductase family type II enzyme heme b subunit
VRIIIKLNAGKLVRKTIQVSLIAGLAWAVLPLSSLLAFNPPKASDLPDAISIKGKETQLKNLTNPIRKDSTNLKKHIKEGGETYFKHCFLCHGDLMDGKGLFGNRLAPPPADFNKAIAQGKSESYFFWRIMKGGKGLPKEFQPWESAMPAWEETLSAEEAWKVILFIFENVKHPVVPNPPVEPTAERGKLVYMEKCVFCHAEDGSGKGVSAFYSSPRPRNFIKGQYKFRTTPFGKIPTDDDLFQMLVRGMPGTTMPSWKHFPEVDLKSLVLYLKTLSKKFAKFKKKGKTHKLTKVDPLPPFDQQSLERGKKFFDATCSGCHGLKGRSDGESTKRNVDIESDAIRPRNLTKPWTFRRGSTPKDLFLTIRTGLSTTAMPRHSNRIYKDRDIWDIVYYIRTLFGVEETIFEVDIPPDSELLNPSVTKKIRAVKVDGPLSLNPGDGAWKSAPSYFIPMAGQILEAEKKYYPTIDNVWIQAIHNGDEIAFNLRWDDPTFDPILKTLADVQESPPPPLPPEFQLEPGDEEATAPVEAPKPQKIPDAIAIQFPAGKSDDGTLPYFLNGDKDHPVNLWKWVSGFNKTVELHALGLQRHSEHPPASQLVHSKVIFNYGQYQLVMKRKLTTPDKNKDVQLEAGSIIPIAVNAWDGNVKETGTQKSISTWFHMTLE